MRLCSYTNQIYFDDLSPPLIDIVLFEFSLSSYRLLGRGFHTLSSTWVSHKSAQTQPNLDGGLFLEKIFAGKRSSSFPQLDNTMQWFLWGLLKF